MPPSTSNPIKKASKVVKDGPDLRDLVYTPTLAPLRQELLPDETFFRGSELVRTQWDAKSKRFVGNCTAQALAGLVDVLRRTELGQAGRVAGDMLYYRGQQVEAADQRRPIDLTNAALPFGLRSLRSALKGFYHYGVCLEESWEREKADSVEIAKEARGVRLGSYYRLRPVLHDYHAALNEVGLIYAAAEIHGGWEQGQVRQNDGMIRIPDDGVGAAGAVGNHAFVIVGYNRDGFLVFNSWGSDWGGYLGCPGNNAGLPGVALWSYQDWAERILDGWVLRLGVSAPEAFKYSFGPQGIAGFVSGEIAHASTPRHEYAGHYVHIEDGELVEKGTLPSTLDSLAATRDLIQERYGGRAEAHKKGADRVYERVLLWIAGGNESTKELTAQIAAMKDHWKGQGVYPVMVIWCSDFIESALSMLGRAMDDARAKVGRQGASLDARIEAEARGVGRAFWRDIKAAADKSAAKDKLGDKRGAGGMYAAFMELLELDPAIGIDVLAEGAGAILLARLLRELTPEEAKRIASVMLMMPACTVDEFEAEYLRWAKLSKKKIDLVMPHRRIEKRMRVGVYGGSLIDLVQMSFEEKPPVRATTDSGEPAEIDWTHADTRILGVVRNGEAANRRLCDHVDYHRIKAVGSGDEPILRMSLITAGAEAQKIVRERILGA